MTETHVMLDLETWGVRPGAALQSIGACTFDPRGDIKSLSSQHGATFYLNIDRDSCERVGLKVEKSTAMWWAEQSASAREALEVDQVSLESAIIKFNLWFKSFGGAIVWSHGAAFDTALYDAAAAAIGLAAPWHYRDIRDTRTLFMVTGFDMLAAAAERTGGVKHNALDDAIFQAEAVQQAYRGRPKKVETWPEEAARLRQEIADRQARLYSTVVGPGRGV